jgi:hypothetical protein
MSLASRVRRVVVSALFLAAATFLAERPASAQVSQDQILQLYFQQLDYLNQLQQQRAQYQQQVYDRLLQEQQRMVEQQRQAYEKYASELQARGTTPEAEAQKAYYNSLSGSQKRAYDLKMKRLQRVAELKQKRESRQATIGTGQPAPAAEAKPKKE